MARLQRSLLSHGSGRSSYFAEIRRRWGGKGVGAANADRDQQAGEFGLAGRKVLAGAGLEHGRDYGLLKGRASRRVDRCRSWCVGAA